MIGVEYAGVTRTLRTFEGLAAASGFSERDCALAAGSGRLAGVVRVAELRRRTQLSAGCLHGSVALAQVRLLEQRVG